MVDFHHEHIHKTDHSADRPDSIEIGTPSKGGTLKVYFDASKPAEADLLIAQAVKIHQTAAALFADSGIAKKEVSK
jgi:hypothetical protein